MAKKTFVLDTNVLIHDPDALFKFQDNDLVIPIYVVEEVDSFKREASERGRNSRHVCRLIDELRAKGDIASGVELGEKLGTLRVEVPDFHDEQDVPADQHGAMDRAILRTAIALNKSLGHVALVTMDVNLRIRAAAHGLEAQHYENSRSKTDLTESVTTETVGEGFVDAFFKDGRAPWGDGQANSSVIIRDEISPSHSALARYHADAKEIRPLKVPREGVMGIRPKSAEQAFALDLLLDDSVSLVTLIGKAGTGKTLLAIAAGLKKILGDGQYTKMLVSRPVVPMGRDIGFLPGDLDEKLNPWMQPIFDNLEFLYSKGVAGAGSDGSYKELIEGGVVQVEPLTYIRGRSIPSQYLIVDEAQNLTPHELKTIITRAGEGTKVVLTGDPHQIDNPYVDATSNGLTVVADRFRGQAIAGHVILTHGERSTLAEIAADLL